jgi:hypothetical protein
MIAVTVNRDVARDGHEYDRWYATLLLLDEPGGPVTRACFWFGSQEDADAFAAAASKAWSARSDEVAPGPEDGRGRVVRAPEE